MPSSDLELRGVAEWIFDKALGDLCMPSRREFQHLLSLEKSEVVRQIANVLRLVHNENWRYVVQLRKMWNRSMLVCFHCSPFFSEWFKT